MHLQTLGRPEPLQVELGLYFTDTPPTNQPVKVGLVSYDIDLPPGATNVVATDEYVLPASVDALGVLPHTHYLGRRIEARAQLPSGEIVPLLTIPAWDFKWQGDYTLREPVFLPAGTRLQMRVAFDNSAANPRNPFDPPRAVWHNETINDEMLLPMFTFVSEKPLDPKGDSFRKFYSTIVRSRFLRRLVDHRYKYVTDPSGTLGVSPDYDPDDDRY
jgi:hypothetical protein